MKELHMKVGANIGDIMLDITQTHILKGSPEKAITAYTDSFMGMTKEHAIMILKNKYVLLANDDGSVKMTDDAEAVKNNAHNIYDWKFIMDKSRDNLFELTQRRLEFETEFMKYFKGDINDFHLIVPVERYFGRDSEAMSVCGVHHLAARLIAGLGFGKGIGNGESIWDRLEAHVLNDECKNYEGALYYTVKYAETIRWMHKEYMKFTSMYHWLVKNEFIERQEFIERNMEWVLADLMRFTKANYYHPMCDDELNKYKTTLYNDILSTSFGKEYIENGIIEKDIMDGYDAGWLSPDGKYYGANGDTSSLIHLNLAEDIIKKLPYKVIDNNYDYTLEQNGWMKIHHNDVYGYFRWSKEADKDETKLYCPTEKQLDKICKYIDKFYNGKLYTEAMTFGSRTSRPDAVSTSALRQMDEIMLHNTFAE